MSPHTMPPPRLQHAWSAIRTVIAGAARSDTRSVHAAQLCLATSLTTARSPLGDDVNETSALFRRELVRAPASG
eukprot:m.1116432 g.1116432  ORF g.1116432 m.1116432 type:complete len:74 (+) comp24376_c0_seq2:3258-3479(+)